MILLAYTMWVMIAIICLAVIFAGIYLNIPIMHGEVPLYTRGAFPYDSRAIHEPITRQEYRDIPTLTKIYTGNNPFDQCIGGGQWLH